MFLRLCFCIATLTAVLVLGDAAAQSREDAEKLKTKIYSTTVESTDIPLITLLVKNSIIQANADKSRLFSYRNTPVDQSDRAKIHIEQKLRYGTVPTDFEYNLFVEPAPDKPGTSQVNAYMVILQNSGARAGPEHAGSVWPENAKIFSDYLDRLYPRLQQHMASLSASRPAPTTSSAPTSAAGLVPEIPSGPVAPSPERKPAFAELERLFSERQFEALYSYALPLAESGEPVAQRAVAYLLLTGQGVAADPQKGIGWLSKATGNNDQVSYGMAYLFGWGVAKDIGAGIRRLQAAAIKGDTHALYFLGQLAEDGGSWGGPAPEIAAQLWAAAAKLGMEIAGHSLKKLEATLDPGAIDAARRYAAGWQVRSVSITR